VVPSICEGEATSMAMCWRIERSDGVGLALTSHDQRITRDGVDHEPTPGMMPASVTRSIGVEPHSGEVSGALSANALSVADLGLGRWDGAQIRLIAVDWENPDAASIPLIAGEVGNVSIKDERFSADLRGAAAKLDAPVCPATSAECRAEFGDKDCRVDLAGRSIAATVVSSAGGELTLDTTFDERFVLGRLRYMSGANCGVSTLILAVAGTVVTVRDLPRASLEDGCRVELREGCDKRFETCVTRFGNGINFRGEPHLPGNDLLTRYPGI
jgi:uncharacterized phage protein (TIGR02218 family)